MHRLPLNHTMLTAFIKKCSSNFGQLSITALLISFSLIATPSLADTEAQNSINNASQASAQTTVQSTNVTLDDNTVIPIDLSGMNTTRHEIALIHVLSDICPSMLESQQRSNFDKAYNTQLSELLPTIDNPQAALQYLSTQQDYQQILRSIREWTMGFSAEENLALCQEMASTV